jgi:hypothetical protein
MHAGSIQNPKSAAGRVYAILLYCKDRWLSGWYLTTEARVTAVGTRVSEVRHQLPAGQRIEHKKTHDGVQGSWYRLVIEPITIPKGFFEVGKSVRITATGFLPVQNND